MTGTKGETTAREPTRAQRAIARKAAEAKATIPHHYLAAEVTLPPAGDEAKVEAGLVRAGARALAAFPLANASYRDGNFELHSRVNVGLVVATEDAYVVVTILDADSKTPKDIHAEIDRLRSRVRANEISASELSGGTFTISYPGRYGADAATPIITPPQVAALAAGAVRDVAVIENGTIVPGRRMTLTLACDHRILFGAQAASFLNEVVRQLEEEAP